MQHHMTPYTQGMEPWAWWGDAFTDDELNFLQEKAKAARSQAGVGGGGQGSVQPNTRRSQVDWLNNTPNTKWVFERFAHIGASLNASYFHLQLSGFGEPLQLTNYDQSENGMYGWHLDCGGKGISRKLSMAMQLSDPSEYEGGELQIFTGGQPQSIPKKRGLVAVFPSFTLHQVTPVTKGSRQSLVAWISGEPFK